MLLSPSAHEVYSPPFPFQAILPLTPAFVRTTGASVKGCAVVKLSALPERTDPCALCRYDHQARGTFETSLMSKVTRSSANARSKAYDGAVNSAALMLIAALRDYMNPQFSSLQLELLRKRVGELERNRSLNTQNVRAVFADIRERAAELLAMELRNENAGNEVEELVNHALNQFLTSAEKCFQTTIDVSHRAIPGLFAERRLYMK